MELWLYFNCGLTVLINNKRNEDSHMCMFSFCELLDLVEVGEFGDFQSIFLYADILAEDHS